MTDRRTARTQVGPGDLVGMAGLVALAGTVLVLWAHLGGELIPAYDGTGYDGRVYADMARNPFAMGDLPLFDTHRAQRVVPSLLAWLVLAPLGLQASTTAIVLWFHVFDFLLVGASVLLWWRVARRVGLGRAAGWVGFVGLVVNYGVLKFTAYYPVLTDTSGFFLGMVVVWAWVERREWWLPVVAVVGAFTWPTVAYAALLLFTLSRDVVMPDPRSRRQRLWSLAVAGVVAGVVAAAALAAHACGGECVTPVMREATVDGLFPLSLALLAVVVFLAVVPVARLLSPGTLLRSVRWERALLSLVIVWATARAVHALADASDATVSRTLANTALGGAVKPLGFLVAHAGYFGALVILLVVVWPRAVAAAARFGPGFVVLLLVFVVLGVSAESRILVNQWPLFVLLVALAVDRLDWGRAQVLALGLLALVQSRVWLPLHRGPLTGDSARYPDQWYGMSIGTRMTLTSYGVMLAVVLVSAVVVAAIMRHGGERRART